MTPIPQPEHADCTSPNLQPELEGYYLYAVLGYLGEVATWDWAFFIPDRSVSPVGTSGTMFHVAEESGSSWKLTKEKRDLFQSPLVVAIIRLADVSSLGNDEESIVSDALLPILQQVPLGDATQQLGFSSRTWFLDAIAVLCDCVILTCNDIWMLEREIRRIWFSAMDKYLENGGWTIYHAERCS